MAISTCAAWLALILHWTGCAGRESPLRLSESAPVAFNEANQIYTDLLEGHVSQGQVNYEALRQDPRLDHYLSSLARISPDTFHTHEERLAFWINVYNAWTLKVICDNYPVKSINDLHFGGLVIGTVLKKTVWDKKVALAGRRRLSLNDIEHRIIRKKFREPRAHFALVCASISCPPLRAEAFTGDRLDEQLDDQARTFFRDPRRNRFDTAKRKAYLSKILDWYAGDFGGGKEDILNYASGFVSEEVADSLRGRPEAWQVEHLPYDWGLNDVSAAGVRR
jgi:hypothetical protein